MIPRCSPGAAAATKPGWKATSTGRCWTYPGDAPIARMTTVFARLRCNPVAPEQRARTGAGIAERVEYTGTTHAQVARKR
eukprot:7863695-Pyramimonas_sp.AAC.1